MCVSKWARATLQIRAQLFALGCYLAFQSPKQKSVSSQSNGQGTCFTFKTEAVLPKTEERHNGNVFLKYFLGIHANCCCSFFSEYSEDWDFQHGLNLSLTPFSTPISLSGASHKAGPIRGCLRAKCLAERLGLLTRVMGLIPTASG